MNFEEVLFQLWMKIKISSKYTTMNALVKGHKMKVEGMFVNLNGMTNHSKKPSFYLKAVFHTSEGLIDTW